MCKLLVVVLMLAPAALLAEDRRADSPFLNLLWLVHSSGTAEATTSAHDVHTKAAIVAALKKGGALTQQTAEGLMTKDTFSRLAGDDGELDPAEVRQFLEQQVPESRKVMFHKLALHARFLTTGFDQIGDSHREPIQELVEWIVENYKSGEQLQINFVCTGNSRRSILGAELGNAAAAYYGLPEIRYYSGGTQPSAFNERTIATLREIGFEIKATGKQAELGSEATNPIYKVRWGRGVAGSAQESLEFSKRYDDPHNPRKGFAAVMICSDADGSCPSVPGAAVRIAMPYLDPKLYDDTEFETRKYAERRDDIGRAMLAVMMQARLRLVSQGKLHIEK
jgi:protein-tyrosine-phosphatase